MLLFEYICKSMRVCFKVNYLKIKSQKLFAMFIPAYVMHI